MVWKSHHMWYVFMIQKVTLYISKFMEAIFLSHVEIHHTLLKLIFHVYARQHISSILKLLPP